MKNTNTLAQKKPVLWLTMTAVFLAMNVALSSFGVPVPGGHLYLNDVVIKRFVRKEIAQNLVLADVLKHRIQRLFGTFRLLYIYDECCLSNAL